MSEIAAWLETALGISPRDHSLYDRALTHGSYGGDTYERFEFLGDRVLGLVIADWLYAAYENDAEGKLSFRLNALVTRASCARVGREIGVALASFAFNDRIVSRATATLDRWQRAEYGPIPVERNGADNVWVRDGDHLIHAESVTGRANATRLFNVTIYNRSGGSLLAIVRAPRAIPQAGGWTLIQATRFDVASGMRSSLGNVQVGAGVRPEQFTLSNVSADGMSFRRLWRAIGELREAGRPTAALQAGLWHKIAGPLSTMLMPLLGAVAAFGLARSGRLFVRAVIGMALGFAYFVADNFGLAMGNLGAYPPLLAAWGPFFLFLLIGEAVLIQTEE